MVLDVKMITVDVDETSAVADQAVRGLKEIVEADAETYALDYFVGVFGVDIVFDALEIAFLEIVGLDLDKVCDFGLVRVRRQ
jgi:hypothetical protein